MPSEPQVPTFSAFVSTWLITWAAVSLKASASREYASVLSRHLIPSFGDLPLDAIAPDHIQEYLAHKIESGLSPRTVDNHLIVLKRVLSTAVDYGLLAANPVDKVARPRTERSDLRFLEPSQLYELIEATEPSWRLLIALPALVGLRKGECLATEWSDFRLDEMTLSVTKSMRNGVLSSPKTMSSSSVVPLPECLLPLIKKRREVAGNHKLVFCRRDGRHLSDATPNRVLERALVAAHLPNIRFHDLRASWTVAHLRAGTDLKTLAHLGRWSDPSTLVSTYSRVVGIGGDAVRNFEESLKQRG